MVALIALPPDMAHRVLRGDQPNSSDDYDYMSPRLSRRRERTFLHFQWNAGVWKTGVQEPALLLDRGREYANPLDSSQNLAIIAMARIFGRRRDSSHYETRPIEVSNWNGYNYVALRALVVLNLRQISPDDPVAIVADMRPSAAFPFAVQRDAEIGAALQFPQEVLDLAVDLAILRLDAIQVLARDRT